MMKKCGKIPEDTVEAYSNLIEENKELKSQVNESETKVKLYEKTMAHKDAENKRLKAEKEELLKTIRAI